MPNVSLMRSRPDHPRMLIGAVDGSHRRSVEIDGNAPRICQLRRIELEPARNASARQSAVAHGDVRPCANFLESGEIELIRTARREQMPGSTSTLEHSEANVTGTARAR